jgi:uncharacterized protein YijF (DUF1287 family)
MKRTLKFILILLLTIVVTDTADCNPKTDLVKAARTQIGKTVLYDSSYKVLNYPNGDVPMDRGVCTDVIIRAMRSSFNIDLQKLVHEDMKMNFSKYPQKWGLKYPDKNIDHRRVPNLQTFFKRQGWYLDISDKAKDYRPGDMVICIVPLQLPHIMIVSDKKNSDGIPFVIHNIGAGVQEEDRLFEFELTGHYRMIRIESLLARTLNCGGPMPNPWYTNPARNLTLRAIEINEAFLRHDVKGPYAHHLKVPDQDVHKFTAKAVMLLHQVNLLREVYEHRDILGKKVIDSYINWATTVLRPWIESDEDLKKTFKLEWGLGNMRAADRMVENRV